MQVALVADSCPQLSATTSRLARLSCVFLLRSLLQSSNHPHLVFLLSSSILLRPLSSAPSPLSLMSLPSSIVPPLSVFSSFILPFSSFLPHVLLRHIVKYSPFVSSSLLFRSLLSYAGCLYIGHSWGKMLAHMRSRHNRKQRELTGTILHKLGKADRNAQQALYRDGKGPAAVKARKRAHPDVAGPENAKRFKIKQKVDCVFNPDAFLLSY